MWDHRVSALREIVIGVGVAFALVLGVAYFIFRQDLYEYSINPRKPFAVEQRNDVPNYEDLEQWAAWPEEDPAAKPLDVFYIHTTTYFSNDSWNGRLNGRARQKVEQILLPGQASIFDPLAHIYAPLYRQATLYAFFTRSLDSSRARALAYGDIALAFETFLSAREVERPFVIVGHGQGAFHGIRLIMDYVENSSIQDYFVVAYLAGSPVPVSLFRRGLETIRPCTRPDEIGCVASWNVFFDGDEPGEFLKHSLYWRDAELLPGETEEILCVNPLTWSADGRVANASENKGSVPLTKRASQQIKPITNTVGAQCQNGILFTDRPRFRSLRRAPFEGDRAHHFADFNLFYENVRENVATRLAAFDAQSAERSLSSEVLD